MTISNGRRGSIGSAAKASLAHGSPTISQSRERSTAGLEPITLHECQHTYASFLMAAGYTLRELMKYIGHSSLQATERYVKLLPPG
ncbi:MAG TPA: tyrosine-type recombinase/integrase [Solirubrobacteraceae bacterium]|nr:tyrosine-type recombinase/integrase [Solirubrobacteraceae bacterium]